MDQCSKVQHKPIAHEDIAGIDESPAWDDVARATFPPPFLSCPLASQRAATASREALAISLLDLAYTHPRATAAHHKAIGVMAEKLMGTVWVKLYLTGMARQ